MLTKQDKEFLKETFATKDDLKIGLEATKAAVIKEITDYLQDHIINLLSEHDSRLDRLEKTVGGFPPLASMSS